MKRQEKQLYGYFKLQTGEIFLDKTWKWLRKGNLKKETESLLIAEQNNAIRTNYVKAKIGLKIKRKEKERQVLELRKVLNKRKTVILIVRGGLERSRKQSRAWKRGCKFQTKVQLRLIRIL